ncbi:ras guanine nucleotide exchange factor domain-containing protein [Chiua virens]|nr:ras guanine nucleotide exchange factor domain-containing protein [Chiua virens]
MAHSPWHPPVPSSSYTKSRQTASSLFRPPRPSTVLTDFPRFDLEKSFPAILAPLSLLRKIPDSQDIDALRALAPLFPIPVGSKYYLAYEAVNYSKNLLLNHVNRIPSHEQSSSRRASIIYVAMQFLDMTMSSLKGFLNAAAYEAAQLKPLPQLPIDDDPAQVSDDSEASSAPSHSSVESHQPESTVGSVVSESTNPANPFQISKMSALLKPLCGRMKKLPSRLNLLGSDYAVSSTAVNSDLGDICTGYVHISVNIRSSLTKFPVAIDRAIAAIPHPDDVTELWKDSKGLAQLASLKALVRYMTSPDGDSDAEIIDVFFLCFRFFSSPRETFDTLVARYDENLACKSHSRAESPSMQVRMRVARLLYLWVDLHWRAEDSEVLGDLTQFAFSRLTKDIPEHASLQLVSSLHQHACAGEKSRGLRKQKTIARAEEKYRREPLTSSWEPREKKAMMKGDLCEAKLEHFHSSGGHAMFALQLTLVLWEKYRAFEPEDAVRYLMSRNGEDSPPTSEVGNKVESFIAYERAVHRFVMDSIGTAESIQKRTELTELFLELANQCHELRNYSASCLIALACDRPTVLPFIKKLKLSPAHERIKSELMDFYTRDNHHMEGYKQALQRCCCPTLPGMMLFIREVARGCGSGAHEEHPTHPGSRLINLKRYRPITWAVRAMEKCHAPFKIQRVDYICDWLEHVLSEYLVGSETEWEERIYNNCRQAEQSGDD